MAYDYCNPANASSFGPSLVNICNATTFLAFISTLESAVEKNNVIGGACERVEPVDVPDEKYDFVIIGGGAGGAVVASRLSENSKFKVLLLEAGIDEPPGAAIPSFASQYLNTGIAWDYNTTNEFNACQSRNGSCPCQMGKNLGGSTTHNGMVYLRGNPADFNNWAAMGNEGWEWNEVMKFYKKSEDNGEIERVGTKYHQTGGLLSVERHPYLDPLGLSILKAATELGYGVSEDLNGNQMTGFSITQATIKNGVRHSVASAFLRPARYRKNLHISLNSHVAKVLIENKKAVGVEFYKNGELRKVYVTKEVVLSAGAINSPQILLLSGIGPRENLQSAGVPVTLHLPGVGQNFHNHMGTALTFTIDEPDTYINNKEVTAKYVRCQTGPLSALGTSALLGLIATDMTEYDYPDIQIFFAGYKAGCAPGEIGALRSDEKRTISGGAFHLHTRSRGTVTLASKNPFDYPVLRVAYLENPYDLKTLIKGLQIALSITKTESLRSYNITMVPVEACSNHEYMSDEYFACVAQHNDPVNHHFVGSCKMGPASDPLAVVDPRLKVHGIKGLRIADASIMPQVPSANTQAPTIMIGERAADFIHKYWSSSGIINHGIDN